MADRLEREIEEIIREKGDLPKPSPRARRQARRAPRPRSDRPRRFSASAGRLLLASLGLLLVAALLWDTVPFMGNVLVFGAVIVFLIALAVAFGRAPSERYEKRWRGQPLYTDTPGTPWRERLQKWWRRLKH